MRLLLLSVAFALARAQVLDELLSARCQAKCLHDFELAAQDKGIRRRTLKHTIIPLCKSDLNCSSCATPCQEPFETVVKCKRLACKDSSSRLDCIRSCQFLNQIYNRKEGSCPKRRSLKEASECVAFCRRDRDCGAGEKCCDQGCGRACLPLLLDKTHGRWLPIPSDLSIKERRRGRSAVLRWELASKDKSHSDLFLIQWRWGLREDTESMNAWQTVAVRNRQYAILKHLLSPGRFYLFRVAAVNLNGTLGFSPPSRPFRLSKSPKAPGAPRNLAPGKTMLTGEGLVSQEISWLPPTSDLPILHYQVTWSAAPAEMPQTSALVQADAPLQVEEDDEEDLVAFHKSRILPSGENRVELADLQPGVRYIVEVHAIVAGEEEEISGEKATLVLEPHLPFSTLAPPPSTAHLAALAVQKPFYEEGVLRALLSWEFDGEQSGAEFAVSWWPVLCQGMAYPRFTLDRPFSALSRTRSLQLFDLKFGCQYKASVAAILPGGEIPTTLARASVRFETPQCRDTPARDQTLTCPTILPAAPSQPSELGCEAKILGPSLIGGHCHWEAPETEDISSWRVVIGQSRDGVMDRDSVLIKIVKSRTQCNLEVRMVSLETLKPGSSYLVEVEALNPIGPSKSASTTFHTPPLPADGSELVGSRLSYQTDAVILELGSAHSPTSSSSLPSLPSLLLTLLCLVWR